VTAGVWKAKGNAPVRTLLSDHLVVLGIDIGGLKVSSLLEICDALTWVLRGILAICVCFL
jgi:hypothetical protein